MSDQRDLDGTTTRGSISGYAAGLFFTLHPDGALSLHRPATADQEALAVDLSADELIALHVFVDAVNLDSLLERMAAQRR